MIYFFEIFQTCSASPWLDREKNTQRMLLVGAYLLIMVITGGPASSLLTVCGRKLILSNRSTSSQLYLVMPDWTTSADVHL